MANCRLLAPHLGGVYRRVTSSNLLLVTAFLLGDRQRIVGSKCSLASRLEARLIAGDVEGAWGVVKQQWPQGLPSIVCAPTSSLMQWNRSGRGAAGELGVADEHRATVVVQRLLGRLGPQLNRRGRSRGTIVVGSPFGEQHSIPSAVIRILSEVMAGRWLIWNLTHRRVRFFGWWKKQVRLQCCSRSRTWNHSSRC